MENKTFTILTRLVSPKKELCDELLAMAEQDQEVRRESAFIFKNWRNPAVYPTNRVLLIKSFSYKKGWN